MQFLAASASTLANYHSVQHKKSVTILAIDSESFGESSMREESPLKQEQPPLNAWLTPGDRGNRHPTRSSIELPHPQSGRSPGRQNTVRTRGLPGRSTPTGIAARRPAVENDALIIYCGSRDSAVEPVDAHPSKVIPGGLPESRTRDDDGYFYDLPMTFANAAPISAGETTT